MLPLAYHKFNQQNTHPSQQKRSQLRPKNLNQQINRTLIIPSILTIKTHTNSINKTPIISQTPFTKLNEQTSNHNKLSAAPQGQRPHGGEL